MDYKIEYIGLNGSIYDGKYVVTLYGWAKRTDKEYLALAAFLLYCDNDVDIDVENTHHIIDYIAEGVTVVHFMV